MRSALIELETNIVRNIIIADPSQDAAPDGYYLISLGERDCAFGWLYDLEADAFVDPNPQVGESPV
jgi:hypothetical protein